MSLLLESLISKFKLILFNKMLNQYFQLRQVTYKSDMRKNYCLQGHKILR